MVSKYKILSKLLPYLAYPTVAEIVLARNIVNVPELEGWVNELAAKDNLSNVPNSEVIKKWIKGNLRNYLIRDHADTDVVKNVKDTDPAWVKKAVDEGKELFFVKTDKAFSDKIEHVIDWFLSGAAPDRLDRLTVAEAIKQSQEWTQQLQKKKANEEMAETGEEVVKSYGDGFAWKKLISEDALVREGDIMGHCVGGYWARVQAGGTEIWSLRDNKNEPHCTLEISPRYVHQIKGKGNGAVAAKYQPYVQDILNTDLRDLEIDSSDLGNAGLIKIDDEIISLSDLKKDPEKVIALAERMTNFGFGEPVDLVKKYEVTEEGCWVTYHGVHDFLDATKIIGGMRNFPTGDLIEILEDFYDPDFSLSEHDDVDDLIESLKSKHSTLYKQVKEEIQKVSEETEDEYRDSRSGEWLQDHSDDSELLEKLSSACRGAISDGWYAGTQDAAYYYVLKKIDGVEFAPPYSEEASVLSRIVANKQEVSLLISYQDLIAGEIGEAGTVYLRDGFDYVYDEKAALEHFEDRLSEEGLL